MRNLLSLVCLILLLGVALPVRAQLRENVPAQDGRVQIYGRSGPSFSLNRLFSSEHFQMNHSYEMSVGSFGRAASSMGMYTNTMRFQFNQKLAARVDLAYAFSPFGRVNPLGRSNDSGRFFLRNAEIAYRPSKRVQLHLQVRQSPYGRYMGPYGFGQPYYGYGGHGYGYDPYHYGGSMNVRTNHHRVDDLFWNPRLR